MRDRMKCFENQTIVNLLAASTIAILVIFGAVHLKELNTSYSVRQFFPKEHSAIDADNSIKMKFELSAVPSYYAILELLTQDQGTWLTQSRIRELQRVTDEISKLPETKSALSLTNLSLPLTVGDELRIGPFTEILSQ